MLTIRELYQEVILDHNKKPHNYYIMQGANKMAQGHNPLCGDQLTLYLKVQDHQLVETSFQGTGCAISIASASLMTDFLRDQTEQAANELFDTMHALLTGRLPADAIQPTHQKTNRPRRRTRLPHADQMRYLSMAHPKCSIK